MKIRIDGENAKHYSKKLVQGSAVMPEPGEVSRVHGNRTENAANAVTARLQNAAISIAKHVVFIRDEVAVNADALSQTVTALHENEELSTREATHGNAIIDDIVIVPAPTAAGSGSSAPSTSAASTPATSADASAATQRQY